jgi:L-fuconolactonase
MSEPYIDAHVHFWDPARLPYPWLAVAPNLAGAHLPEDYAQATAADPAEGYVFVEADCARDCAMDELAWVESLARRDSQLVAIVPHVTIDRGRASEQALDALASHLLVRGVRHLVQDEPDPHHAARPEFIAGVRAAGRRGLGFELCCRPAQWAAAAALARACPETTIVLDHVGKPAIGGDIAPWQRAIDRLAACPNVVGKLSGLVTEADHGTWQVADLRPYFTHLYAAFGPDRLLFGSDWPVVTLAASPVRWREAVRVLTAELTAPERTALFCGTARRVYRLP